MTIGKTDIAFGTRTSTSKGVINLVRKLHGEECANTLKAEMANLRKNGNNDDFLGLSIEHPETAHKRVQKRRVELCGPNVGEIGRVPWQKEDRNLRLRYRRENVVSSVKVDESQPIPLLRFLLNTPENIKEFVQNLYSRSSQGLDFLQITKRK